MRISISLADAGRGAVREVYRRPATRTTPATTLAQTRAVEQRTTFTTCRAARTRTERKTTEACAREETERSATLTAEPTEVTRPS